MSDLNRRTFLSLSAASAGAVLLGASGCTALPGAGSDNTATLFAEVVAEVDDAAEPIADEATLTANISQAVTRFLDGLNDAQRGQATYEFADDERVRWHWTTPSGFPRNGLPCAK